MTINTYKLNGVRKAFLNIRGIKVHPNQDLASFKCITANCPGFRLRIRELEMGWELDIGVKKDFDRWANSTNFCQPVTYNEIDFADIDFNASIRQARKIVRAKDFNWNSYFDTITLDAGIVWRKM